MFLWDRWKAVACTKTVTLPRHIARKACDACRYAKKKRASVFSFTAAVDFFGRVAVEQITNKEKSHEPESCIRHRRHGRHRDCHLPAPGQGGLEGPRRLWPYP